MIGIRYEHQNLDVFPDIEMSFELVNQVFSSGDASVLPGSFSFPFDIPATIRNRQILNYPDRVDNAEPFVRQGEVEVLFNNIPLFKGTLKVTKTTKTSEGRIKIYIVANPMTSLKNKELTDLVLEGPRTWTGDFLDHMLATANTPEDFDYVFFPVWNEEQNDFEEDDDSLNFQNFFDIDTGEFIENSGALTPFVKLEYVLKQIFAEEETGYAFQNHFQPVNDLELRRLYLYNNVDCKVGNVTTAPDLPTELNLSNHLPKIKRTDFLKKTAAQWCLGFFTNVFDRTVKLIPLQNILSRPPADDWTQYALEGIDIQENDQAPDGFNYSQTQDLPPGIPEPTELEVLNTTADYQDELSSLAAGYYYIESQARIVEIKLFSGIPTGTRSWLRHRGVYFGNNLQFETGMESFFSILAEGLDNYRPFTKVSRWHEIVDVTTTYEFQTEDCPVGLMFYRGMQEQFSGDANSPLACNHVWLATHTGGDRNAITISGVSQGLAKRSLNWFGEYGLYNTAHRTWNEMLRNGKRVTISFILPITKLIAFRFEDKIRIGNQDYFVKRLKVSISPRGIEPVEAELFTVI